MFIEAKDDGGGEWWQLDYWSYRSCKAPVKPTSSSFYRPDALLSPNQSSVSKHWRENITLHGLAYPKLTWGFSYCLWPLIAPGYLGGGLPCLSSALWCQYPITTEFSITENSQITRARKCAKAMYIKFKFLHIVNNYYE